MNGFQWEMLFPVNWRTAEERELHQIILHEIKSEVEKKWRSDVEEPLKI